MRRSTLFQVWGTTDPYSLRNRLPRPHGGEVSVLRSATPGAPCGRSSGLEDKARSRPEDDRGVCGLWGLDALDGVREAGALQELSDGPSPEAGLGPLSQAARMKPVLERITHHIEKLADPHTMRGFRVWHWQAIRDLAQKELDREFAELEALNSVKADPALEVSVCE